MSAKLKNYRTGVEIAVALKLGVTVDEAKDKLVDHSNLIESWCDSGVPFPDTAEMIVMEWNT